MARTRAYHILGISPGASHAEARRAYLERMKIVHPDRFDPKVQPAEWQKANDMLLELNAAYEEIKNHPTVLEAVPSSPPRSTRAYNPLKSQPKRWYAKPMVVWAIPVIIVVGLLLKHGPALQPEAIRAAPGMPAVTLPSLLRPPPTGPERAFPPNGSVARFQDRPAVAPFTVVAAPGMNYVVKLEELDTRTETLMMFVHAGHTAKTKVPLGRYRLKYVTGATWYGEHQLFGPGTSYYQADRTLVFVQNTTGYSGHIVTLVRQANGNLPTSALPANQW